MFIWLAGISRLNRLPDWDQCNEFCPIDRFRALKRIQIPHQLITVHINDRLSNSLWCFLGGLPLIFCGLTPEPHASNADFENMRKCSGQVPAEYLAPRRVTGTVVRTRMKQSKPAEWCFGTSCSCKS